MTITNYWKYKIWHYIRFKVTGIEWKVNKFHLATSVLIIFNNERKAIVLNIANLTLVYWFQENKNENNRLILEIFILNVTYPAIHHFNTSIYTNF